MSKICKAHNCSKLHDEDGELCPMCKSMGYEVGMRDTQNENTKTDTDLPH